MLLANKSYTPEVVEISRKVSINVEARFNALRHLKCTTE
ncbi:hypothetical protein VCRA2120E57_300001 [Vibrio crassostreae]|nr:hypothetical protein VCRA2120E57_300001 [Vibrio crassostreae]